jgi:NAD(P)-dependent dehydrogenase (short-subunit alcohol dehydrogenase family)
LAHLAFATYGAVHLLFNNAGVSVDNTVWEHTLADWQWVLGVNLWGVINGLHFFVPHMLAQKSEGHIVNTASGAGITSHTGLGAYTESKHGVVALSETLALDLAAQGARLKASVLCPGWVNTRIADAGRNRPQVLQNTREQEQNQLALASMVQASQQSVQGGIPSMQVAGMVFDAIRRDKFYIFTDSTIKPGAQLRMEDILQERQPTDAYALARRLALQADQ